MNNVIIPNWHFGEKVLIFRSDRSKCDERPTIILDGNKLQYKCKDSDIGKILCSAELIDGMFEDGMIISISERGEVECLHHESKQEIDIFMTNKCNSNCIMCPVSEYDRKKSDERYVEWLKEYIKILPSDVSYINITGGEPTLALDIFFEIMELLKNKFQNSDFQMLSNGRSFADIFFLNSVIACTPIGTRFAIPLHSSDRSIHDMITQSEGSFEQTVRGIRNLLNKKQKVEIRIVISKKNCDRLTETVLYILKHFRDVFCVNFIAMEMMGNAAVNRKEVWIDYDEAFKKAKTAIDILVNEGVDVQLYNFPLCFVERGYWQMAANSITDYKICYMDECKDCKVKALCGGMFFSTKYIMRPKVKPVE